MEEHVSRHTMAAGIIMVDRLEKAERSTRLYM